MTKEEWFRNTNWNKEIEEFFELKLKRARGSHSKAQYLRIQASYLLGSSNTNLHKTGIKLMVRLISEYPEETGHTNFGKEELGDYYLKQKNYLKAEDYFREVANHYYGSSRSGTTGIADIKLSRTILESQQSKKYEEAIQIATTKFDDSNGSIIMNDTKYYYVETLALLYDKIRNSEQAKRFAKEAIKLNANKEPQFSRHKNVGITMISEERIEKMKLIANE